MCSTRQLTTLGVLFCLYSMVCSQPNCQTFNDRDVVCTAGPSDYVLQRGLVSDNNRTTGITLKYCRITEVDYEAFENDFYLKYIDLSGNKIEKLNLGVLDGNNEVTYLNLSHNKLTTFPLGLFDRKPNLEVLDLKGNRLNFLELGVFDPLKKLIHLDLSSNALVGKHIDPYIFDQCHSIKFIDFSRNDMSDSPDNLLQAFNAMDFLNLDRCSLKQVPTFARKPNMKTMKHLMMSTNQITYLKSGSFNELDNLEILNFADNLITDIAADVFTPLRKLKMVILRNNKLKSLPDSLFKDLVALGNVDLSANLVEYIPVNAFRGTKLKNLNLSMNKFSYLEPNFCLELRNTGVRLKKFYFNDNPWQCACLNEILREIKTYNIEYNRAKYDGDDPVCVTTKMFVCKRQLTDNEIFNEMYDNLKSGE